MLKDKEILQEFIIKILEDNLNVIYAQIWREGQMTAEYKRMPVKTRLNTWSICKGVVSCAAGIAINENLIDLNKKIVDIFPEYSSSRKCENLSQITLEHLLTMTSGLET